MESLYGHLVALLFISFPEVDRTGKKFPNTPGRGLFTMERATVMVFWGGCEGNRRPLVREIGRESEKDQNRQRGEIRPEQQGFGGRIERAEWRDAERWGGGGEMVRG